MQKDSLSIQNGEPDIIKISLPDLLAVFWRSRWMILNITAIVVICGMANAFYVAQYKSEGFFQFGSSIPTSSEAELGITLSDYKRFAALFATSERFEEYVRDKKQDSVASVDNLRKALGSPGGIMKFIGPVYPFTKLDAKNLMGQPTENSTNVIGLGISAESKEPQTAQQMVDFLGHYVMDSIVYAIYSDELQRKQSELLSKILAIDNTIINSKEALEEYRRKGADLKDILIRYPNSTNQQAQQVVSVSADNARYLSPVTQLVTTEVQISEANEKILKARREQQQVILLQEYYHQAKALLDSTKSGETLLRGLESVKDRVFKDKNLNDEVVKEVYNTITISNQDAINAYFEQSHFIASPNLPSRSSVRPVFVLVCSLLFGLFLSMVVVFGRNWWNNNRTKIFG